MKRLIAAAVALVLTPYALTAQEDILYREAPNGLTILVRPTHAAPVASVHVFVKTGSVHEGAYLGCGISHMLEHLVAAGNTSSATEEDSKKALEAIGGVSNAHTSYARTVYFINCAADYVGRAIDLLADWTLNAVITRELFEREHAVVLREVERGLDNVDRRTWRTAMENVFRVAPLRFPIIGYKEAVEALTLEDVVDYYRRTYAPGNIAVVAVGDFDAGKIASRIEESFGRFPRRTVAAPVLADEPPQLAPRRAEIRFPTRKARLHIDWRTIPLTHPDLYALDVGAAVLGWGRSSRLVREIVDKKRLADTISCWSWTPEFGSGTFFVSATLEGDKVGEAEEAILQAVYGLCREPPTDEELQRVRTQIEARYVYDNETAEDQAERIGGDFLSTFDPHFTEHYIDRIRAVDADDVVEIAARYLVPERLCVTIVWPASTATSGAAPAEAVGPSRAEAGMTVLPNGLRVVVERDTTVPAVSMQAYIGAGLGAEDESNCGINNLTGSMLVRGTTSRSYADISAAFDGIGGTISSGGGNNTFYLSARALARNFEEAFDIFADCLKNPAFPEDELANVRRLTIAAIRRQTDNAVREAQLEFRRRFYERPPYRFGPLGSEETVRQLTSDHLKAFYVAHAVPANIVLAIFGDVEPDEAVALAEKHFSGMPGRALEPTRGEGAPDLIESQRHDVSSTKANQSVIYMGYPSVRFEDVEDRFAMLVLDSLASGIQYPRGWLHDDLRGAGIVYAVHAANIPSPKVPGYFMIYAQCDPARVDEALDIIFKDLERARAGEFSEEELAAAKAQALTLELLDRQTASARATEAALDELYGLGYDFGRKFPELVHAVSREDIVRVAEKYLTHYVLVVTHPEEASPDE